MIDKTKLVSRIQNIIGDQANQFADIIDLEIEQSLRRFTSENILYWNTFNISGLTATNNRIQLPTDTARVLYLYDSAGNTNYMGAAAERFRLHDASSDSAGTTPFLVERDSDGIEYIVLPANINQNLTFSVVYTKEFTEITAQIPDNLYNWLLGDTSFMILSDVEDPDSNLISRYRGIADRCRQDEINRSNKKSYTRYNQQPTPFSHQFNVNSNGI